MAESSAKEVIAWHAAETALRRAAPVCTVEAVMPLAVEPVYVAIPWALLKAACAQVLTAEAKEETQAVQQAGRNAQLFIPS